jgi:hypothetical protein
VTLGGNFYRSHICLKQNRFFLKPSEIAVLSEGIREPEGTLLLREVAEKSAEPTFLQKMEESEEKGSAHPEESVGYLFNVPGIL